MSAETRTDAGLTLIEVLITLALISLVIPAIAAALIVGFKTTDDSRARLQSANDAELVSTWFATDVASADDVSTSDAVCAGAPPVVRLRSSLEGVTTDAAYVVVGADLHRRVCTDGVLTLDSVLARDIGAAPRVACAPVPACPATPESVALTVEVPIGPFTISATRRPS